MLEIDFVIQKDATGVLTGFSLTARPETYSECFCLSFPIAAHEGKASMKVEGDKVVFEHQGVDASDKLGIYGISGGGTFAANLASEDVEPLTEFLERTGKYADAKFGFRYEQAFAKGFTVFVKND